MTPRSVPAPGTVDVWTIDLAAADASAQAFAAQLGRDEIARAARMRFAVHRVRFIARRYAYRDILSRYVGCQPRELEFVFGEFGKPTLAMQGIEHNSTHREAIAMLAVTGSSGVGIDVERVRDRGDHYEWLSAGERRQILLLPRANRTAEALRMWTRKEAYVKALGIGVTALDDGMRVPREHAPQSTRWSITDLDPAPGYVASLAVPFDRPAIVTCRWTASIAVSGTVQ